MRTNLNIRGTSRRSLRRRVFHGLAALLWVAALAPLPAAAGQVYRLGPEDRVRIKIVEWRAGKGESYEWTALNNDYSVNAEGNLSLPLVGTIEAEGKTASEVGDQISDALFKRASLGSRPVTSVEVVQFRPVYVVGDVDHPGEYAYRPGLTVIQAVGLAGGFYRPPETGMLRLGRDEITAAGDLDSARADRRRTLARRARLEAELAGAQTIAVPPELAGDPDGGRLIAEESAVMAARRDALNAQLTGFAALKSLYGKELDELRQRIANQKQQIDLAQRDLSGITTLMQKGLAVNARQLTLQENVAQLQGQMLDLETAAVRADEERQKAERDASDAENQFKTSIEADLQDARARLEQLSVKLGTSSALIDETQTTAARLAAVQSAPQSRTFAIIRGTGEKVAQSEADEYTPVEPGDVIRITAAPSRAGSAPVGIADK